MTNITPMTPAMSGTEEADSRRKPRPTVAKMSSAPMSDRQAKDHPTFAAEMRCGRAAGTVTRRIRSIPSDPMLRAARRYRGGTVRNASECDADPEHRADDRHEAQGGLRQPEPDDGEGHPRDRREGLEPED